MQRSVILLQSLAGSAFCFNAGTLLECSVSESERLIDSGIARTLLSDEPTELQILTKSRFPIVADRSADHSSAVPAVPVPNEEPSTKNPELVQPVQEQQRPRRRRP